MFFYCVRRSVYGMIVSYIMMMMTFRKGSVEKMLMIDSIQIGIDLSSLKSIKQAEDQQRQIEKDGYTLQSTKRIGYDFIVLGFLRPMFTTSYEV